MLDNANALLATMAIRPTSMTMVRFRVGVMGELLLGGLNERAMDRTRTPEFRCTRHW